MSDDGQSKPFVEVVDGVEYPIEQTENSVKPEDGDQSVVDQFPDADLDGDAA